MKKYVIVFRNRAKVELDTYNYTVCNGFNAKDAVTAAVTTDKCRREDIVLVTDVLNIIRLALGYEL